LQGTSYMQKNKSLAVIFSVLPDLQTDPAYTASISNVPGNYIKDTTQVNDFLAVQVTETFTLAMPTQTGFTQQVVTAGNSKVLDLRTFRKAFLNYASGGPDETLMNYMNVEEEAPQAPVLASQNN